MTSTWTNSVRKGLCQVQEFPGHRQKWVQVTGKLDWLGSETDALHARHRGIDTEGGGDSKEGDEDSDEKERDGNEDGESEDEDGDELNGDHRKGNGEGDDGKG